MKLDLGTLAGLIARGNEIVSTLETPNESPAQFAQNLRNIAADPQKCGALMHVVAMFESHLRAAKSVVVIADAA